MTQATLDLMPEQHETDREPARSLVPTEELLRVGMLAGRSLIEQPKPARKRKDTRTLSLFDTKEMF